MEPPLPMTLLVPRVPRGKKDLSRKASEGCWQGHVDSPRCGIVGDGESEPDADRTPTEKTTRGACGTQAGLGRATMDAGERPREEGPQETQTAGDLGAVVLSGPLLCDMSRE